MGLAYTFFVRIFYYRGQRKTTTQGKTNKILPCNQGFYIQIILTIYKNTLVEGKSQNCQKKDTKLNFTFLSVFIIIGTIPK